MAKSTAAIFTKDGRINVHAWASDLAIRETGKRSVDRQTVAQAAELLRLAIEDMACWGDTPAASKWMTIFWAHWPHHPHDQRWVAFLKLLAQRSPSARKARRRATAEKPAFSRAKDKRRA